MLYSLAAKATVLQKKINHVKAYAAPARTPEVCTYGCPAGTGLSAAGVQIKAFASHYPGWETSVRAGNEWLRFPQRCNGVTVWQHQQSDWPLSFTDVAVLRTRRCLFYRMMASWPVACSQTAQGQLSIYCRVSLAPLPSSYGILGCSTGEAGGEVGSTRTRGILQVCNAQGPHGPRR